nr:hypothetical protein JVH1_3941 [Rhodococcus sp. JVH1]
MMSTASASTLPQQRAATWSGRGVMISVSEWDEVVLSVVIRGRE